MNKKIYIEAGANDGFFQSRSIHLENNAEYLGILIEPVQSCFLQCQKNRPNCLHYYCALVDFSYTDQDIEIHLHQQYNAMSTIIKSDKENYNNSIRVPAKTLDSILEENNITKIEYLFLDVEGYELNVLKGINFDKRHFASIEIECHYPLLNITKETEVWQHTQYLNQRGYHLSEQNNDDGHLKLIFTSLKE